MNSSTQKSKIRPVMLAVGSSVALSLASMAFATSVQSVAAQLQTNKLAKAYNNVASTTTSKTANAASKMPNGKCAAGKCAKGQCGGMSKSSNPLSTATNKATSTIQTASNNVSQTASKVASDASSK